MLLFVVVLGFWLGFCVGVMSLVWYFYVIVVVVVGYIVCLVLGLVMVEFEVVFEYIVICVLVVIVGVCCLSLVIVFFSCRIVFGWVC